MKIISTKQLLDISIALTREKDGDKLLERILNVAMDITQCDGGTLYVYKDNALDFKIMITKSMNIRKGGSHEESSLPSVPIDRTNVCACAVLENKMINIPDVYRSKKYDFSGPRKYDALTGYKTSSILVVPMEDNDGDIIGVLQLINAMDDKGEVIAFPKESESVVQALASQAAISLTNMNYAMKIRSLMDSVVRTLSRTIHTRTPYNVTHTANMALYAEGFIDWLNEKDFGWTFSEIERRQFLTTVWLHDVGKLTIPLEIMNKETRLGIFLERVMDRLDIIEMLAKIESLENGTDFNKVLQEVESVRNFIYEANSVGYMSDDLLERVRALGNKQYKDKSGVMKPWITAGEIECLCIRKGTLTAHERKIIESHVVMTAKILDEMNFYGDYAMVPVWASQHHEFLNGTGYPKGLTAEELAPEARLLTIIDIFDGLSAVDRPYKKEIPLETVFQIMHEMVDEGKLDGNIMKLFEESRVWERVQRKNVYF